MLAVPQVPDLGQQMPDFTNFGEDATLMYQSDVKIILIDFFGAIGATRLALEMVSGRQPIAHILVEPCGHARAVVRKRFPTTSLWSEAVEDFQPATAFTMIQALLPVCQGDGVMVVVSASPPTTSLGQGCFESTWTGKVLQWIKTFRELSVGQWWSVKTAMATDIMSDQNIAKLAVGLAAKAGMLHAAVLDPGKVDEDVETIVYNRPKILWTDFQLVMEGVKYPTITLGDAPCPIIPFTDSEVEAGDGSWCVRLLPRPRDVVDGPWQLHEKVADCKVALDSLPMPSDARFGRALSSSESEEFPLSVLERWRLDSGQYPASSYRTANLAWDVQGNWKSLTPKMREMIYGLPVDHTRLDGGVREASALDDRIRAKLVAMSQHMAVAVVVAHAILKIYDESRLAAQPRGRARGGECST